MNERRYRTPKVLSVVVVLLILVVGVQAYYLRAMSDRDAGLEGKETAAAVEASTREKSNNNEEESGEAENSGPEEAVPEGDAPPSPVHPEDGADFFTAPFEADEWDPFAEMRRMQRTIDRMFAESFNRFGRSPRFESLIEPVGFSPKMDVVDREDHYRVTVDLPGADEAGVEVTLEDRVLTIKGERVQTVKEQDEEGRFLRRERRVGKFARSIALPGPVDPAGMKTSQEEGILTIEIPKAKDS